jgi:serine/threonine protein kinase
MAYSPPEVLRGEPYRPIPRDIWSLGVLLYILLTGKYPFGSQPNSRTKNRILNEEPRWDELKIPPLAKDLLQRMLEKDPSKRITLKEVQAHPWCRQSNPLLRKGFFRSASSLMADLMPQAADKPKAEAETLAPMLGAPEISVGA